MQIKKFLSNATYATFLAGAGIVMVNGIFFEEAGEQAVRYEQSITKHVDQVKQVLGLQSEAKEKYKQYIGEDLAFLQSQIDQNPRYKTMLDIDVIVKEQTWVDKLFAPAVWGNILADSLSGKSPQQISSYYYKYSGNDVGYSYTQDSPEKPQIMVGVNALEKGMGILSQAQRVWDHDTQQMTTFVFYHEVGHHVGMNMLKDKETIENHLTELQSLYGISLKPYEKAIAISQYREGFADKFALQMTKLRYPGIDIEEKLKSWSQLRLDHGAGDIQHITTMGLMFQAQMGHDLNSIVENSSKSALVNLSMGVAAMPEKVMVNGEEDFKPIDEKKALVRMKKMRSYMREKNITLTPNSKP